MRNLLSRVSDGLSEYFLGTKTKEFFDRQVSEISEFDYDKNARDYIGHLKIMSRVYNILGKWIPNLAEIASIGLAIGAFSKGNTNLFYDAAMITVGGESCRLILRPEKEEISTGTGILKAGFLLQKANSRLLRKLEENKGSYGVSLPPDLD
jgi:hypothetical protein